MEKSSGLPSHVAIIMDGNGRWAGKRGLPRLAGHRAGVENIRPVLQHLGKRGVRYVTIYAFSTENWNRPRDEVKGLFGLLEQVIGKESQELHKNGVKIRHIGDGERLSPALREQIAAAIDLTRDNTGMTLCVALNYGGRAEILNAVKKIIAAGLPASEIDEATFEKYLDTAGLPYVDLVIRTGGEIRTSNFLIWQTAYSEYYFTPVLWPDFNAAEVDKALQTFSQRQRRFGGL